jgi:hypothetical protein
MNRGFGRCTMALGAAAVALGFAPGAWAACGFYPAAKAKIHPSSLTGPWSGLNRQAGQARLLRTAGGEDLDQLLSPPIVGFWHVKFISDGVTSGIPGGIPPGAEVDAGYSQWHSDGTEIMNSGGRAPNTGDFCLGVWTQVGPLQYKLNHFAAAWDPTQGKDDSAGNPTGEIVGPANIRENITLAPNGQSFQGSFTIDQYDENMNLLQHLQGKITGTRITVSTSPSSVF